MLLHVPKVLSVEQVAHCRERLAQAGWADGRITAGYQSAKAKDNAQLPENDPVARELGAIILDALAKNPTFFSAALPQRVFPPLFNRYEGGQAFGFHVDNAIRYDRSRGGMDTVRTDLSATLFLSDPDDYEGGELVVEDAFGSHIVKLAAGGLILYPASSLHHVTTVTRGVRTASFFWIQSLVRDDAKRGLLLDMDVAIQRLSGAVGAVDPSVLSLTGTYHNLLRMWAEV